MYGSKWDFDLELDRVSHLHSLDIAISDLFYELLKKPLMHNLIYKREIVLN